MTTEQKERRKGERTRRIIGYLNLVIGVLLIVVSVLLLVSLTTEAANRKETARAVITSRIDAARDTCNLFVGLANAAVGKGDTAARKRTDAYIARTPLANCNTYALSVVNPPKAPTK